MTVLKRHYYAGHDPVKAVTIEDLRTMAWRRLPQFVSEFVEGGAEEENTLRSNRKIFDRLSFAPKVLTGVDRVDLEVTLFGQRSALPVVIAPTGFAGLLWRHGDCALAKSAAKAGIPFAQSMASNATVSVVAQTPGLRHWFQVYILHARSATQEILERARTAGCETLLVTVDSAAYGNREWDRRAYRQGTDLLMKRKLEMLRHPRWIANALRDGMPSFANILEFLPETQRSFASSAAWTRSQVDASLNWRDLEWVRSLWPGQLVVKGIARLDDALKAVEIGANGIVLSNHGGRQLDGALPPLSVLPEVASKLKGKATLLVDSGFRRGTDVVKALALGADAVLLGRAVLYGLAAAGTDGVTRALDIISEEMARAMALLGVGKIGDLTNDCLVSPEYLSHLLEGKGGYAAARS
jgi:(S)-mandelate dehydrogenase